MRYSEIVIGRQGRERGREREREREREKEKVGGEQSVREKEKNDRLESGGPGAFLIN